jgi:outer membrane murein-binding lipoprotein Lpp
MDPMRIMPTTLFACVLGFAALALSACGETEANRASESVPPQQVQDLDERVATLEREIGKLREQLEAVRKGQAPSGPSEETPPEPETSGASDDAGSSDTPPAASARAGSPGNGSSSGGSRSGSGSGSDGGSGSGSGSDGGSRPTVEDICGPNPAPEC